MKSPPICVPAPLLRFDKSTESASSPKSLYQIRPFVLLRADVNAIFKYIVPLYFGFMSIYLFVSPAFLYPSSVFSLQLGPLNEIPSCRLILSPVPSATFISPYSSEQLYSFCAVSQFPNIQVYFPLSAFPHIGIDSSANTI